MDFFTEKAEVIIADGFVGNILSKFTEGLGRAFAAYAQKRLGSALDEITIAKFAAEMVQLTNRTRSNGGPLFGVKGPVIVGHGSSKANEISDAVSTAVRYVDLGMVDIMSEDLANMNKENAAKAAGSGAGR